MKKHFSFILIITLILSVYSFSISAAVTNDMGDTGRSTVQRNIYEDKFIEFVYGDVADDPDFIPDYEHYEEVYYHYAQGGEPDWVLVNAYFQPDPGMSYAVFDVVALLYAPSCVPFPLGLGVYDVQADTFYSLGEAWDRDFSELQEKFVDIMTGDDPINGQFSLYLLGDVDRDNEISVIDATYIQRYEAGMEELTDDVLDGLEFSYPAYGPTLKYLSDFNRDGERNVLDATCIQRYLAGMSYPVG